MKKLHLYILVTIQFLVAPMTGFSQETENQGVFAFAYNKQGAYATNAAIPNAKYKTAKTVFDQLVEAKGVKNMIRPQFVMENAERRPAWTKPAEALVVLEEKAFDLCMSNGKDSLNSLAALLAHELIHYYEKHDWHNGMAKELSEFGVLSSSENQGGSQQLEFEADFLGGMLAHMAGYQTLGIMPDLLGQIYTNYQLESDEDGTHPTIDERRAIAVKSDVLLTKYSRIFDMSLYLTAIGEYELASDYLHFIVIQTNFQSREIYNNLGVLYLLRAIDTYSASEMPFNVPVELELSSRLSARAVNPATRTNLLEDARYYFKSAVILDEEFVPAQVNLAVTHLLEGSDLDADYYARKALGGATDMDDINGMSDAQIILGILSAQKGDHEKASSYFIESDSPLGRHNLCVLQERADCTTTRSHKSDKASPSIDEVSLDQLYSRIMQDKEEALLSIDLDVVNSFHTIAKDHSEIFVHLNNQTMGVYNFFQIVNTPTLVYNNVLKVGMSVAEMDQHFDDPTKIFCANNSCLRHYENENLIVIANQLDEVQEWIIYKSSESK